MCEAPFGPFRQIGPVPFFLDQQIAYRRRQIDADQFVGRFLGQADGFGNLINQRISCPWSEQELWVVCLAPAELESLQRTLGELIEEGSYGHGLVRAADDGFGDFPFVGARAADAGAGDALGLDHQLQIVGGFFFGGNIVAALTLALSGHRPKVGRERGRVIRGIIFLWDNCR